MTRELTCIGCPMGCSLTVHVNENDKDNAIEVSGYTCNRGLDYAKKEVTDPRRIVTSTVKVLNGDKPVVSVKTKSDIPKDMIFDCTNELANISVNAPIRIGDVIIENLLGTGVSVVATQNISTI